MSTLPNPYRTSPIEPENSRLSKKDADDLVKIIANELSLGHENNSYDGSLSRMLDFIGYKKADNGTYLRQGELIPSFPQGSKPADDRFIAVYVVFKGNKIIVNGKIHDLDSAMRDIDTIKDIIRSHDDYKDNDGPHGKTLLSLAAIPILGMGTILTEQMIFFALGVASPFVTAGSYAIHKRVNYKKNFRKEVSMLSKHARSYLFGASALRQIRNEFEDARETNLNLSYYKKLADKGLKLTPDEFLGLRNTFNWYRLESSFSEFLKAPSLRRYSRQQIELIWEVL